MIDIQAVRVSADLLSLSEDLTTLKRVSSSGGGEWAGPCPFCGGVDRFRVQPHRDDPRWLCRNCTDGKWQDVIELVERRDNVSFMNACTRLFEQHVEISPEDRERIQAEREERRVAQEQSEAQAQEAARKALDASGAALAFHANLDRLDKRDLWQARGLAPLWQDYFQVGYCPNMVFYHDGISFTTETLTIPTWRPTQQLDREPSYVWKCDGLAHRLLMPDPPGGKYRPHLAGTGKQLFKCDIYDPVIRGEVLLVEGEIKAMVTYAALQDTYPTPSILRRISVVGIAGKGFKAAWVPEFSEADQIYICLDPDASDVSPKIARLLGRERCFILDLFGKIDDEIIDKTILAHDLPGLMMTARRV